LRLELIIGTELNGTIHVKHFHLFETIWRFNPRWNNAFSFTSYYACSTL